MTEKQCRNCGLVKPVSEFQKNTKRSDGYKVWCKSCGKDYAYQLKWGRTQEEFRVEFGERCNICGQPEKIIGKDLVYHSLCVDHDHNCTWCGGKGCPKCVRGLLCRSCNYQIGVLEARPKWMKAALEYLGREDF